MTGIDKITERILAEGRERASQIVLQAEEDCKRIATEYAERTETTRREIRDNSIAECERLVNEARDTAEAIHNEIMEKARRSVVDEVISGAKRKLCNSQHNKYRELLIALLSSALIEQDREERIIAARDEDYVLPERYEVLMNDLDRDTFGEEVVEVGRRLAERRIGAEKAARVVISYDRVNIDGGLMLRVGEDVVDCSLDTLLSRIYEQMKTELDNCLFAD